jgi:FKBP-type peptidyl-prolyl cis-trans isomerase SlpA
LHYRLALYRGEDVEPISTIIDTFCDRPATLLVGAGQIAPPLEEILIGMKVGCRDVFRLEPDQAFGAYNPALLQHVSRSTLREHGVVEENLSAGDWVEFNAPTGGRYAGVFKEMNDLSALFDFNHPLAGQSLLFEVHILGIL